MSQVSRKRDRTARLLKLELLLWRHNRGIEVAELARLCSVSIRTVYRDLMALETELDVPIWQDDNKRGVVEGYFLPPVTLTQAEAMNVFLAARLMQNYSHVYNPSLVATFMKLNTILPSHLRDQVNNTLDSLEKLPRDERKFRNFSRLTEAWLSRRRVTLRYRELDPQEPVETLIEPYFIEPSISGLSSYVVAFCHLKKVIRAFKIDHIAGEVAISPETYEIPASFNVNDYISSAWDIFTSDELKTRGAIGAVKLRFSAKVGKSVMETIWHPSQQTEFQKDGTMIMTLKVRNTLSFRTWIMRWETEVEVLEPKALRNQIGMTVHSLANTYSDVKPDRFGKSDKGKKPKANLLADFERVSDEQWKRIAPLLPLPLSTGRPRSDDRYILNGILYVLNNKVRWSDIPHSYGAHTTFFTRYQKWKRTGLWKKIQSVLLSVANSQALCILTD
jgi:predicted DNA-binding transcriptional regulator YafY/transposase